MFSIMDRFKRPQPQADTSNDDGELLALLGPDVEDPEDLRRQLAVCEDQRDTDDARWEALDQQHNPRSFLEQAAIGSLRCTAW